MIKLNNINVKLNLITAIVGIDLKLLTKEDVLREIELTELEKIDPIDIEKLYNSSELSIEEFKNILKKYCKLSDNKYLIGKKIWQIAFLQEINNDNKSQLEKLHTIANIWALFNYPNEWEGFIYYMPPKKDEATGNDYLFEKFSNYLKREKLSLSNYQFLLMEQ